VAPWRLVAASAAGSARAIGEGGFGLFAKTCPNYVFRHRKYLLLNFVSFAETNTDVILDKATANLGVSFQDGNHLLDYD
jgi:hypothetical protein